MGPDPDEHLACSLLEDIFAGPDWTREELELDDEERDR